MKTGRLFAVLLVLALLVALGACGSDEDKSNGGGGGVEAAFLKSMIPHHESAVEMARMAREQGEHRQVKELADAIVSAQETEISQMEQIYQQLYGEEILPDPEAGEELGLSMDEAGMHGGMSELEGAMQDFDKVFIDQMIPHHQGAIRQAHVLLGEGVDDPELRGLAQAIISAQSTEIEQMNSWRKRWYGKESPAGGVPSEDELPPSDEGHEEH